MYKYYIHDIFTLIDAQNIYHINTHNDTLLVSLFPIDPLSRGWCINPHHDRLLFTADMQRKD